MKTEDKHNNDYKFLVKDERVLSTITWARGFDYFHRMESSDCAIDREWLDDMVLYAFNHKGYLVMLWKSIPDDTEMYSINMAWEEDGGENAGMVEHWFINNGEMFYLRGEGIFMAEQVSSELKDAGLDIDLFISESTVAKIAAQND